MRLDHRAFINEHRPLDHRMRRDFAQKRGLQMALQVIRDFREDFPRMLTALEQERMLGLRQIQQIGDP